jgi:DNA-binding IclR family transcriptional regulator
LRRESQPGTSANRSVQKACSILRAAASGADGHTASQLARETGLPWATASRLIRTLELEGFLFRLRESECYILGPDLLRLVRSGDGARFLTSLARPALDRLAAELEETVSLTVLRPDGSLEVVDQIDSPRLLRSADWDRPYPLHATSIGKLRLAAYDERLLEELLSLPLERYTEATITDPEALRLELVRVHETGYSEAVDELEEGLAACSVGVSGPDGELLAMVTVSGPSFRFDRAARGRALEPVREAAQSVARLLA